VDPALGVAGWIAEKGIRAWKVAGNSELGTGDRRVGGADSRDVFRRLGKPTSGKVG
jgi:hypothetical protein